MNDQVVQIGGVVLIALLAFAGAIWFINEQPPPLPPAPAPTPLAELEPIEPAPPEDAEPKANPDGKRPPPREVVPARSTFEFDGKSLDVSLLNPQIFWGLPSPRKLTDKEKQAIARLGTTHGTHSFRFSSMTLSDGSTIPGVPAPTVQEVSQKVLELVQTQGLADGFESAVRQFALPHNLRHLTVQVTVHPDWSEIEAILGKPQATHEGDLWLDKPPLKANDYYRAVWQRYGWLKFAVCKGQVKAIQADMQYATLVRADDVPGGRSKPDPSKVSKKKTRPPGAPPREVDALKLLGQATGVQVTTRRTLKPDPRVEDLIRDAQGLVGQDVYPGLIRTARQLKGNFQIDQLIITPSQNPPWEQVQEIMDETKFITEDSRTVPGLTIKWHRYFWLEFGVVQGRVERVRASVSTVPSTGP